VKTPSPDGNGTVRDISQFYAALGKSLRWRGGNMRKR